METVEVSYGHSWKPLPIEVRIRNCGVIDLDHKRLLIYGGFSDRAVSTMLIDTEHNLVSNYEGHTIAGSYSHYSMVFRDIQGVIFN
jgi:hypothetical protein